MFRIIKDIANDTLKRDKDGVRRWSKTALTMWSAWLLSMFMAVYDLIQHGFRYDVWVALVAVATGIKLTDKISKKIQPENKTE